MIAIGIVSLTLGRWVVLAEPATATAEEADIVEVINTVARVSVAARVVLTAVTAALEVRRLIRMGSATDADA